MSIKLLSQVWGLDVRGTEREILQVMCDHADDSGREARPSIGYIAWKVGCDERTVIRHVKAMRQKGALLLERKARDHSPNVYRVNLSAYPQKPKYEPKGDTGADEYAAKKRGDKMPSQPTPERGDKTGERGDKMTQRGDMSLSPEPSFESSFESLSIRFQKYGGIMNPRMMIDFEIVYKANTDNRDKRLQHAIETIEKKRNFWRAIDAYREWTPPKPATSYPQKREQFTRPSEGAKFSRLPIRTD